MTLAIAMLAPAGAAVIAAPAAQATIFTGVWTNQNGYTDTFTFNDTDIVAANSSEMDYALLSDQLGNNMVGLATTGDISGVYLNGTATKIDILSPAPYSGNTAAPGIKAGVYAGQAFSSTLILTAAPVPEADAWALMVAGAAMAGGSLRGARRRQGRASASAKA